LHFLLGLARSGEARRAKEVHVKDSADGDLRPSTPDTRAPAAPDASIAPAPAALPAAAPHPEPAAAPPAATAAERQGIDRRLFLGLSLGALPAVGLAGVGLRAVEAETVAPPELAPPPTAAPAPAGANGANGAQRIEVTLQLNGQPRRLRVDPRASLLDALREDLALTGTKKGCDHGQCGSCTVLVDERRVLSCLTLAAAASEHRVTTIEGLAQGDRLHPVQAAFLAHDAFQCGYCTPGQILSAVGLLAEGCPAEAAAIRERMSGNICRCGAYPNIVAAIQQARAGRTA
jgi:xanthine dehydrogenase YagT iron-sulfur-binding subunit